MEIRFTQRGFARAEFVDRYGAKCSIQDSSLATEDALWLGVDELGDQYKPERMQPHEQVRMHLNKEMAAELIPLLQKFVETGSIR